MLLRKSNVETVGANVCQTAAAKPWSLNHQVTIGGYDYDS